MPGLQIFKLVHKVTAGRAGKKNLFAIVYSKRVLMSSLACGEIGWVPAET